MNKLEKLFATKTEIEAEIELEHQKELAVLREAERQEALAQQKKEQERLDELVMRRVNDVVKTIKNIVGDKVNDPDYMFYLVCLLIMSYDRYYIQGCPVNGQPEFYRQIEGLTRQYSKEEK